MFAQDRLASAEQDKYTAGREQGSAVMMQSSTDQETLAQHRSGRDITAHFITHTQITLLKRCLILKGDK